MLNEKNLSKIKVIDFTSINEKDSGKMKKWESPKIDSLKHKFTMLEPIPISTTRSCNDEISCEPIPLWQCPCCKSFIAGYDEVKLHMQTCDLCKNSCS